ncbi:hypothetical protein [Streptomyces parvus]|uniref:hypothetical protein n=1 Tax=Streptomyces parvus TaxID=66428 RepID=UPI003680870C
MFFNLTGEELYAEMIMQRTNDSRSFLVVEGDGDIAVFDKHLAQDRFTIIPAHGKKTAHDALSLAFSDNFAGIYSILDRDWLNLIPGGLEDARIVHTDRYDMDMCVFFLSGVYVSVASSFCTRGGYRVGSEGCSEEEIRDICLSMTFPVGVLRFISERDKLGLRMRDFPLHEVVDKSDLSINLDLLVSVAIDRSKKASIDPQFLKNSLAAEMVRIDDRARYCSGHDVARAFVILARERWSTTVSADSVERTARAAVGWEIFRELSVYNDSGQWFGGRTEMIWAA